MTFRNIDDIPRRKGNFIELRLTEYEKIKDTCEDRLNTIRFYLQENSTLRGELEDLRKQYLYRTPAIVELEELLHNLPKKSLPNYSGKQHISMDRLYQFITDIKERHLFVNE